MPDKSDDEETEVRAVHRKDSRIFARHRAVGYISNHVPASSRYFPKRRENMISTCIGRSIQIFSASQFRLLHVGGAHPDDITAVATAQLYVFTAAANCIYAWRAGKHLLHVYRGHTHNVWTILPFGKHLVAVDEANVLKVWDVEDEEVYLDLPFNKDEFHVTALAHPPTYVNKIVLGSEQGRLQLWNVHENRLVYSFVGHRSRVTCIESAPALDVVGIGHTDGTIVLLNLKFDEVMMTFHQDCGAVTKLSFRTDGPPILVSGSVDGHLAFWNLEERKGVDQIRAHLATVATVICLPNEPLVLTTSPDNSMKMWICDLPGGGARQIRIRDGHTAPPLCIRYYGEEGKFLLSSGKDSTMRAFSTISESMHKSLGRATYTPKSVKKKNRLAEDDAIMPPIKEFVSETTGEIEWDNIAAIHDGIAETTTWSICRSSMADQRLVPPKLRRLKNGDVRTQATSITLTHCGNFVVMGYSNGALERFNIQSGIHRDSYGAPPPAHKAAVRGVVVDVLNTYVVSGCSEGHLRFWPFKGKGAAAAESMKFDFGIEMMRLHRESALIAIALSSFVLHVVDFDTRVLVRIFEGHTGRINDIAFTPDSRWVVSAAMDGIIKVWDIPSSFMIDHFRTERPCVSLDVSPNGDFLATAHVDYLGVHLWANKVIFGGITLRSVDPHSEAPYVDMPTQVATELQLENGDEKKIAMQKDDEDADDDDDDTDDEDVDTEQVARSMAKMNVGKDDDGAEAAGNEDEEGEEINPAYVSPAQLAPDLITLSNVPESRWRNLLDLDAIKKRNKPKSALQVPKQAPFFLPTVAGLDMKFDVANGEEEPTASGSKFKQITSLSNLTAFGRMLEAAATEEDYAKCFNHLKELGPTMIDFEIKSLHPLSGGTCLAMVQFLRTIEQILRSNADYELGQIYLASFLRSHGHKLADYPDVMATLQSVGEVQQRSWEELEKQFLYALGVVGALRNFAR